MYIEHICKYTYENWVVTQIEWVEAPQMCHLRRNRRRIAAGKVRLRGWSGSAFVFWCVGELEGPHARLSQGPAGRECRAPNIRHFHNHDRQQHFSVIIIVTIIILREGTFIHRHFQGNLGNLLHTYIHIYTFIPTIYTNIYNTYNIHRYLHTYNIYRYIQIYTIIYKYIYIHEGGVVADCEYVTIMRNTLLFVSLYVIDLDWPPPSSFNVTVGGERIWWIT